MGISLGATMITLRERIKAALDEDEPNTPNIWWKHERLAKAARELLPLVLAEMQNIAAITAERDTYRTEWESACERLRNDDPQIERLSARVAEVKEELAAMTADRDKLDRDNDAIRDECKRVMAERDAMREALEKIASFTGASRRLVPVIFAIVDGALAA